jgi:hypothetical protein
VSAKIFPAASDLLERTIPKDIGNKTEYLGELSSLKQLTPVLTALLVADAEQINFKDSPSECLNWAMETTGLDRGYLRHLIRVGRILLAVDTQVFDIMKYLSFKKLLDILTLQKNDIPKFILSHGKKLIKMSDDEVRREVYDIRGKELLSHVPQKGKYQPDLWNSIDAICDKEEKDFQEAAMSDDFNEDKACKFAFSGLGLLTASTTYWQVKGSDNAEVLAAIETELRKEADRLEKLRNGMTARLQSA